MNAIQPNIVPKINARSIGFQQVENIGNFLKACEKLGLHKSDLFDPPDLFEGKNLNLVTNTIHVLGKKRKRNREMNEKEREIND